MSTFSGISTALSALQAQRQVMDVTGQNIANAGTAGYTRQRVELQPAADSGSPMVYATHTGVGHGVTVATISRAYDGLAAARVNQQTGDHAFLAGRAATLSQLESLTKEPTDAGLAGQLDGLWSAWADLAAHPDNTGTRDVVLEQTRTVVASIRDGYDSTASLWSSRLQQAQASVADVNATSASVADLNNRIVTTRAAGSSANELMDQRDHLVTHLVELTGASTQDRGDGTVDVLLGGSALVAGVSAKAVALKASPAGALPTDMRSATGTTIGLQYTDGGSAAPASGALAADLEALGTTYPRAGALYDGVASALAARVNDLQTQTGAADLDGHSPPAAVFSSGGGAGVTASNLTVAITSGRQLAAGLSANGANDGSVAAQVAALGTAAPKALGTSAVAVPSPNTTWKDWVADLGTRSATASQRADAAQTSLTAAVSVQESGASVSLDEEAAGLVAAQKAYQGAARVLTAVDEAIDTLINKTGLVGR